MLFPLGSRISLWRLNSGFPPLSSAGSRSSYGGAGPDGALLLLVGWGSNGSKREGRPEPPS